MKLDNADFLFKLHVRCIPRVPLRRVMAMRGHRLVADTKGRWVGKHYGSHRRYHAAVHARSA